MLRTKKGEQNRIKSLPKGNAHWNYNKNPSKLTLHRRLHREHGPAHEYKCKCGKQAKDWAFIGKGEYTDNRSDYQPMCRSCHVKMDGHCKNGNDNWKKFTRDNKGRFKHL